MSRYRVKTVITSIGERLPILVDGSGNPVWGASIFVLTELRARNRSASTIENTLRALLIFHVFLEQRKIELDDRMSSGRILTLDEVEDLVRTCRLPVDDIVEPPFAENTLQNSVVPISLERYRSRGGCSLCKVVVPAVTATRLTYIRDYLKWYLSDRASRLCNGNQERLALESAGQLVISAINARLPPPDHRGLLTGREGLGPEVVSELLRVIDPNSLDNPWLDAHSRCRNELIIHWLYYLGLRRGELLGVRVSDIDFIKGTVAILRRADDIGDPRKYQPNAKTKAREIPISPVLQGKTSNYVINFRAPLSARRKDDFLFVASDSGAPLSISSFSKIFNVLREKCERLPRNLFAHLLRHTWNDRFSEEMDRQNATQETEKKVRSYLMGWSETSGTAATYTRRHVRKKAEQVSLSMQAKILEGRKI